MTRKNLLSCLLLISFFPLSAQMEIPLYPDIVPNNLASTDQGISEKRGPKSGLARSNTTHPTLTIFQAPHPNGRAIIVCPGGGYVRTAFEKEGTRVAERLLQDSITVFVLNYRLPDPRWQEDPSVAPLQDARAAIRYVRSRAEAYQVNPQKIGIMGFSAGGHLAATAATMALPDEVALPDARPDFVILIYPVISFSDQLTHKGSRTRLIGENPNENDILRWSADNQVTSDSPPAFLVHAGNDKSVPVGNSLAYYSACIRAGVAAEMHLYPAGGHGFGLYNPTTADDWTKRLSHWLQGLD